MASFGEGYSVHALYLVGFQDFSDSGGVHVAAQIQLDHQLALSLPSSATRLDISATRVFLNSLAIRGQISAGLSALIVTSVRFERLFRDGHRPIAERMFQFDAKGWQKLTLFLQAVSGARRCKPRAMVETCFSSDTLSG